MESAINSLITSDTRSIQPLPDLIQSMIDACYYNADSECPICSVLKRKIECMSSGAAGLGSDSTMLLELEQSKLIRHQFPKCTQVYFFPQKSSSTSYFSTDIPPIGDFTVGEADVSCLGAEPRHSDDFRDSAKSDMNDPLSFEKNMPLRYGLHQLIREVEQSRNHRLVFSRLTQVQLRSLLAQVTCTETLCKEVEGDPSSHRLLRIEQELNDLMAREDPGRAAIDRQSSIGGMTSNSKRSGQDLGY